jgi:MHS family proline/betaine transporter-like MFS transporter
MLLVLVRFAQGLSAGGEFVGSIVFLVEHAPAHRRNLYGSLSYVGSVIGGMLGAGVAWFATSFIPASELQDWGWRLPFLTGLVIVAGGLWLRLGIPETPTFSELKAKGAMDHHPLRTALRDHSREIAVTAGLNWTMSTGYYVVFVWLATDLSKFVGLPLSTALAIATAGLFCGALVTPAASLLADRFGERAVLAAAGIAMMLTAVPLLLLAGVGTVIAATAAQLLLALVMAGFMGTLPVVFVALNRAAVRCSTVSVGYNLAVTLFGGTAPLAATVLVKITGWQAAPGLYLAATALVGLALLRYVPGRGRTDDGGCTNPPYELSSG